jgi:hypothetical protein
MTTYGKNQRPKSFVSSRIDSASPPPWCNRQDEPLKAPLHRNMGLRFFRYTLEFFGHNAQVRALQRIHAVPAAATD